MSADKHDADKVGKEETSNLSCPLYEHKPAKLAS